VKREHHVRDNVPPASMQSPSTAPTASRSSKQRPNKYRVAAMGKRSTLLFPGRRVDPPLRHGARARVGLRRESDFGIPNLTLCLTQGPPQTRRDDRVTPPRVSAISLDEQRSANSSIVIGRRIPAPTFLEQDSRGQSPGDACTPNGGPASQGSPGQEARGGGRGQRVEANHTHRRHASHTMRV
jgi:hypothetical protein